MLRQLVFTVLILLAPGQKALASDQNGISLFSEEEATQLRLTDEEWNRNIVKRSASFGPNILIQNPTVKHESVGPTIEAPIPADLWVIFEDKNAPVDMTSLRIKIKKGFFSKSLTKILQPYIQGNSLRGEKLEIPEGRYAVEFSITDEDGSRTVETFHLLVGDS